MDSIKLLFYKGVLAHFAASLTWKDLAGIKVAVCLDMSTLREFKRISRLSFHGKLNVLVILIKMTEEVSSFFGTVWPNDESIIYISKP